MDKSEEVQCRRSCQAAAWSLTAPHLARIQSAGGQNLPRRARNLHSDLYLFHFLIKPLAYSNIKENSLSIGLLSNLEKAELAQIRSLGKTDPFH